jgi:serine phosphatase RsbU (regulator of sigma subunit)
MEDSASGGRLRDLESQVSRLETAVGELKILNDIAIAISSASSLEDVIELVVRKCIRHLGVEQAAVIVIDPQDKNRQFRTVVRGADTSREVAPFRLGTMLQGWTLKYRKALRINDLRQDKRFSDFAEGDSPIHSILSVPMMIGGRMIGLVNVFNKKGADPFTDDDQRLLSIIASQSAQVIENARLSEEEQMLEAVRREMEVAYHIQTDLLPKGAPAVPGYDIAGVSIPAKSVGGDYFDFVDAGDGRFVVCLGDVSGKGMPAALLMANLQATLRSLVQRDPAPVACLTQANRLMFEVTGMDRFVTLFFGLLDSRTHTLRYASAGHNPPVLVRQGEEPCLLETRGIILGCFEEAVYAEESLPLAPGDTLIVYSDGITEAIDSSEEEFGLEKLEKLASTIAPQSARSINQSVLDTVRHHQGGAPQLDDMTIISLRRMSPGNHR